MMQTEFGSTIGFALLDPESSRFLRTTWMLHVEAPLQLSALSAYVRFLQKREVDKLQEATRKRNVYARHSWENSFYVRRVGELAEQSVIEVFLPGDPSEIIDEGRRIAEMIETVVVVSTVLFSSRKRVQNQLAITNHRKDVIDVVFGPSFNFLRSTSRRERPVRGITVDDRFTRRFYRLGLDRVILVALQEDTIGQRLRQGLQWLFDARLEPSTSAAVVKTAISLESLLGGSDTEPLSRTLSERAAFLLSDEPHVRQHVSKAVRNFYDMRSRVVHGGRRKPKIPQPRLLEAAERLILLLIITLAANAKTFGSPDELVRWAEAQRWGAAQNISRLYRAGDLKRALTRAGGA